MIDSEGALELHPSLGIADIIVDLTSSGTTLKDNRLKEIDQGRVLDSASCLIGHAPGLSRLCDEGETGELALMLDAMDGVRASEGMLHLEVVGSPSSGPGNGRKRRRLASRARCPAPGARRGLGRRRQRRLARHLSHRRRQARRLPAPPVSTRSQPRRGPAGPVRVRQGWALDVRLTSDAAGRECRAWSTVSRPNVQVEFRREEQPNVYSRKATGHR